MASKKFRKPKGRKKSDMKRMATAFTQSDLVIKQTKEVRMKFQETKENNVFGKFKFRLRLPNLLFRLDTLEDVKC